MLGMKSILMMTCLAAVASYVGNRIWLLALGRRGALLIAPWWEEGCKLLAVSLLPGRPLLAVYGLFGVLELAYDLWQGEEGRGALLGALAVAGHGLAAGAGALVLARTGSLGYTFVTAALTDTACTLLAFERILPTVDAAGSARSQ
jgi:hypothetical protein